MDNNLLSRKFIFAILAVILGFILVFINKVEPLDFLHFVEIIGGTYVIGNVGATVAGKIGN